MGYFDALTSSSFKTTPNGHRLFFPWGVLGRGYVIGSEPEYERLRAQVKKFIIVWVAFGIPAAIGALALRQYRYPAGLVAIAVLLAFYAAFYISWVLYLVWGLQPSHESLSLRETMATQAREQNPMLLWVLEICSIVFVAGSLFILISNPGTWPTATGGAVFFGICAVCFAFMLVMRRGT
jgi:hypothetical protein